MIYVTGAQVLTFVGISTPSGEETEWAGACASAVNAGIDDRLNEFTVDDPSPGFDELKVAARYAAAEAFKRKEAAFGLTGYSDIEGAAIRVSRDYLTGIAPIIARWTIPGIG